MKYKIGDFLFYVGDNKYVGNKFEKFVIYDIYEDLQYYRIQKVSENWRIWTEKIDNIDGKIPKTDRSFYGIGESEFRNMKIDKILT